MERLALNSFFICFNFLKLPRVEARQKKIKSAPRDRCQLNGICDTE